MIFEFIISLAHTLGIALGIGGATIANVINIKSERNPELAPAAMRLLQPISKVIWVGVILMFITHIIELILSPDILILWIKFLVILLILAGGITITFGFLPKLLKLAPTPPAKPSADFISLKAKLKILSLSLLVLWYTDLVLTVIFH